MFARAFGICCFCFSSAVAAAAAAATARVLLVLLGVCFSSSSNSLAKAMMDAVQNPQKSAGCEYLHYKLP